MGEPALREPVSLPRVWIALVDDSLRAEMELRLETMVASARSRRPAPGSDEEVAAVAEFTVLMTRIFLALGMDVSEGLSDGVSGQVDTLILQEYAATSLLRKLAYRHLHQSLEAFARLAAVYARFGDFIEGAREAMSDTPLEGPALDHRDDEPVAGIAREATSDTLLEGPGSDHRDDEPVAGIDAEAMLRDEPPLLAAHTLLFLVCVALEVRQGELEEFAYWAKRAVESSRQLDAILPELVAGLEGSAARYRAERAWLGWDAHEIESELKGWRTLVE